MIRVSTEQVRQNAGTILNHQGLIDPGEIPDSYDNDERLSLATIYVLTEIYHTLFVVIKKMGGGRGR